MPSSDNPHDTLFKEILSQPSDAAGEFEAVLPPEILRLIDLGTLVPVPASFVDEAFRRFYSDRLFLVDLWGRPAYVYLLLEHKNAPERLGVFQLHRYMVRIWEQELAKSPPPAFLPPIIPVILHHGEHGWTAPTEFHELFDPELMAVPALAKLTPSFEVVLDDLCRHSDEEIKARTMGAFTQVGLLLLRDARRLGPVEMLVSIGRWAAMMREVAEAPDGRRALMILLGYIARVVADINPAELAAAIKQAIPDAEDTLATMAERWLEQGMQQGYAKGLEQGLEEGLERGQVATLIRQLTRKFGDVDAVLLERVNSADPETLAKCTDRILFAETVEEVFED